MSVVTAYLHGNIVYVCLQDRDRCEKINFFTLQEILIL